MSKVSGDQCNCPGNHLQSSGSPLLRRWIECQKDSSFATKNPGKTDCSWICFIIHDFQVSYVGKLPWIYAVMFTWNDTFESLDLRIFTFQVDIPNKIIKIRVRDRSKELLRNLCASNQMALQHHGNPKIAALEPLHLSHLYHGCNLLQIWAINLHPDTIRAKHGKIMEKSRSIRWLTISFSCLRCVPWYSRSRDSQIWLCREILGAVVSQAPNSSSKLGHGTVFNRLCWLAVSNLDPDSDAKYALNKQNICPGLSIIEHNISVFPASKI